MKFADITTCDVANGEGLGVVIWCQGCSLNCPYCHNPETHNPDCGHEFTKIEEEKIIKEFNKPYITRLTLSGGHPLEPYNIDGCLKLCKRIKSEYPHVKIWCYTGWVWENIKDYEIVKYIDVLVDGPFIVEKKDLCLKWRGSNNQNIIDVQASLAKGEMVLYDS